MKIQILMAGLMVAISLPALAQDADFELKSASPSPYAWAKSGEKAAYGAKVAAAGGGKVVGGKISDDGAWPWQVALLIPGVPMGPDAQFCGGSMILDTWVLTAAHCVHMQDADGTWADLATTDLEILVGTNVIAPGNGEVIKVAGVYRHPEYLGTEFDFDIALLKLERAPSVPYQTINVPDAEFGDQLDQPGVITKVTGWGLLEGGTHPEALHETEIQMMDRQLCNQTLLNDRAEAAAEGFGYAAGVLSLKEDDAYALWDALIAKAPAPMSENMLCSGSFEGGKTACSGDSGGPLVVPLTDGSYIQAGVVSWGLSAANGQGCEENALFSAYTRISNFVPWLDDTINANP